MSVHLSVNNENILNEGLRKVAVDEYDKYPKQFTSICTVESTSKKYEYDDVYNGLGRFEETSENEDASEDNIAELGKVTYTVRDFAKKLYIGKDLFEDELYAVHKPLYKKGAEVAFAAAETQELDVANIYNRAFNSSYTSGYNAEVLCESGHESTTGTDQSNILATAQDFSVDALVDAIEQAALTKNDRGLPVYMKPKMILAYPGEMDAVWTTLESKLRPDVSTNNTNWITKYNLEAQFNPRLTDTDAWFLLLEDPMGAGVKMFQRENLNIWKNEKDDRLRYKIIFSMRYSLGWTDWRYVIGTPGAS